MFLVWVPCWALQAGERDGEEVVQLYIHDCVASRVRPVRELKGFRKASEESWDEERVKCHMNDS